MIEAAMVRRMALRAAVAGPVPIAALWALLGPEAAWSAALGIAMTLLNLWLAARILGAVAERAPQLLLPAGLGAFALGLAVLTAIALVLTRADAADFVITGLALVVSHLGLVLWEATGAYDGADTATGIEQGVHG